MEDRLREIAGRYAEIEDQLARPEVIRDNNRFRELTREHAQIRPIVAKYEEYRRVQRELAESEEVLKDEKDEEMREMVRSEMALLGDRLDALDAELMVLLLPRDPNSGKNIIMEIRAGTGGEEAALFAADLFRMYSRYIDDQGWRLEFIDGNPTGIGGYKEVVFSVSGAGAYDNLKYESGVHRVQRIPSTESGGRIHTSAVTVAVLPEAEESDIVIDPGDLRIDVYRSTGHGGQSVNTTDSAVRITHIPTGMVVTCQDEKSQLKNKTKALKVLRARLFENMERERLEKEAREKRSQVGSGDRSERIRTYNFPQSRVTDHRIGLTVHALESFLEGDLDTVIDALKRHDVEQKLKTAVG
ncbi:MAG TPA: peptide chain release factor 1 [Spirochaetota bacterium]|nr:peptide chain release factor 1 [Spirochaetota bacterium]OPZ38652.1 MAG: Peptide chain release factor 1 [Spirochaetes bacterium ADurb.BinA120]HNU90680.1 peptide chain release factor 1 [Spirochaetota bacterium]HPV96751.1 peptide chain release factor 1 [Spirochaetota bacterium]